jgi:hypothetical protein
MQVPEIFFGALLATALFAAGLVMGVHSDMSKAWLMHDAAGFFTSLLVIVGLFQLGVFYWQLRLIRRSLIDAERAANAAQRSADIATRQADTARATLETMQDTAQRQLRAYVVALGKDFSQRGTDDRFVLHIDIRNTGQTPAYNVKAVSRTCVLEHPLNTAFDFTLNEGVEPSVTMLGPQQFFEHDSVAESVLSDIQLSEIRAAIGPGDIGIRLYTYGTVTYRDAFQIERHTNFCFSLIWGDDGTAVAHASQYHNDAD